MKKFDINNGDIIQLATGEFVEVSFKKVNKPVTELIPGKYYILKYTGEYCHMSSLTGEISDGREYMNGKKFQYIGEAEITVGVGILKSIRRIFIDNSAQVRYLMMGVSNLDYVVSEVE